jgi:hypothetical protein
VDVAADARGADGIDDVLCSANVNAVECLSSETAGQNDSHEMDRGLTPAGRFVQRRSITKVADHRENAIRRHVAVLRPQLRR